MPRRWEMFPNAVGCIDGTLHEINRPSENQHLFFSGHRRYHALSTQIIVDINKNIRYFKSGFEGHHNDAAQFLELPPIGPGAALDFPADCVLLGDKGYANRYPVITPFRRNQIAAGVDGTFQLMYNTEVASCRIIIEHVISYVKKYRAVKECYRHERCMQPIVVDVCGFLAQRQIQLGHDLRG